MSVLIKIASFTLIKGLFFLFLSNEVLNFKEIGSSYSGGVETTLAKYPSIEAMSRPLKPDVETHFDIVLTPKNSGIFDVYVKSIGIPHSSDISHYPTSGVQDHQNEYVSVYSVTVNP